MSCSPGARDAHEEASIYVQSEGRMLIIDTGRSPTDVEAHEGEIDPTGQLDHADRVPQVEEQGAPAVPAQEQQIAGFSSDARRRLRYRLHAMRRDADALLVTLTYHETHPHPRTAKEHLDAWWKRVRRRYPDAAAIWKMEPQERGAPHFHVLIYGLPFLPVQRACSWWHAITEEASSQHAKAGLDLEGVGVNGDGKLQAYLAGYMGEKYESWPGGVEDVGRWWGCLGRDCLPYADWDDARIYLTSSDAKALIVDLLDRWGSDLDVIPPALTVCCRGDPHEVVERLLDRT